MVRRDTMRIDRTNSAVTAKIVMVTIGKTMSSYPVPLAEGILLCGVFLEIWEVGCERRSPRLEDYRETTRGNVTEHRVSSWRKGEKHGKNTL